MSWRETLGVKDSSPSFNTQYTQKSPAHTNSAHIEGFAECGSNLISDLIIACKGLSITPTEVRDLLAPEDVKSWQQGEISINDLESYARSLVQFREMDQGKIPSHYTQHATCKHCGPIWLWISAEVLGCPWCRNRAAGRPIPRP